MVQRSFDDSRDTLLDSFNASLARGHQTAELTEAVRKLTTEVLHLKCDLAGVKAALLQLQERVGMKEVPQTPSSAQDWAQLYFQEPYACSQVLQLLGDIVEEAVQNNILHGEDLCDVLQVGADSGAPKWRAIRLIAPAVKTTKFRKLAREVLQEKNVSSNDVRTTLPKQGSTLYRKAASGPHILQKACLRDLRMKIKDQDK